MKNDSHPLLQALKARSKSTANPKMEPFEMPRSLQIDHGEIPGLPGRKVGEPITVTLSGHIHSQSNDGHAVMHIASVKPDSKEMDEKESPDADKATESKEA